MSIGIITGGVEHKEFDSEVKHVYQGMQTLRQTVTTRHNVVGDVYNFRRMGSGIANQKAVQSLVTPMNIDHALIACNLTDWLAPEYTDIFSQATINFDEKVELATTVGKALGRRDDQMVIDALETAGATAGLSGVFPVNADTAYFYDQSAETDERFSLNTLTNIRTHYNKLEVFNEPIYCVIGAAGIKGLLDDTTVTSADYNNVRCLVNGEIDTFMGFKFKIIGVRNGEGGITGEGSATDQYAFFYTKSAIGMAIGIDIRTSIDWIPERTSWLVNGLLKAGAVSRENQAIAKVLYSTTNEA